MPRYDKVADKNLMTFVVFRINYKILFLNTKLYCSKIDFVTGY